MPSMNTRFHRIASLLALAVAVPAGAQNVLTRPAEQPARPQVLVNATLHPVDGAPIADGRLRIEGGRIAALGGAEVSTAGAEVVDLGGRHVYPGLVAANTVMGLVEVEAVRATVDQAEVSAIKPEVRAEVAVNPDSEHIPVTRANGVLSVLVRPQPGADGVLIGRSAVLQLDGWTWEAMTVKAPVGVHLEWPTTLLPEGLPPKMAEELLKAQAKKRVELDGALAAAKAYAAARAAGPVEPPDLRWEAMLPVLRGEQPLFVHANDAEAIEDALAFAREQALRIVLVGGLEAWRVAALLKQQDVPVVIAGTHLLPLRRFDPVDAAYTNPAKLHAAGVRYAIASPGDGFSTSNERNLPYQAATAVAHGLPADEALKAITLYPAQILGVADRLGSLAVGKDATLFVADGDPLEVRTQVLRAWIGGREVDLNNRHRQLRDKYQQKYAGR
jgi:imidazolonepropionase-like amidohydrolase